MLSTTIDANGNPLDDHEAILGAECLRLQERAIRLRAALERIRDLEWQEQYIGPWTQEEAHRIARDALDPQQAGSAG